MSWTEERVELLRKLWLDGLSASQIAAELSHGITRNAVIGKVHRLGLSGRVKAPSPASASMAPRPKPAARPSPPRPIAPIVMGATALALKPRAAPAPAPVQEAEIIPLSERVTIMELREAMCRWPMGDPTSPDFRFCGARTAEAGGAYCGAHARIAYQPAQDRRRR
ncbi:MAG: GcrA cell cycle regulator [Methylobacteriaceae bacterium]|nr:GcrA cell cycle regulator [Methylobacteriaceae bacterium]